MKKIVCLAVCFSFLFALAVYSDEVRTWTSTGGQHKVEAELVKIADDGKSITLYQRDGTGYVVELDKLSKVDQTYVAKQKTAANQPKGQEQKTATPPTPKTSVPAKSATPAPRLYTVNELEDWVWRTTFNSSGTNAAYLNDCRASIAIYLYYVQMAYGTRLSDDQLHARMRLLREDVNANLSTWRRTVGLQKRNVDFIFDRIAAKTGYSGTIYDLERKAKNLYKEKSVMQGM